MARDFYCHVHVQGCTSLLGGLSQSHYMIHHSLLFPPSCNDIPDGGGSISVGPRLRTTWSRELCWRSKICTVSKKENKPLLFQAGVGSFVGITHCSLFWKTSLSYTPVPFLHSYFIASAIHSALLCTILLCKLFLTYLRIQTV